jgi:hypothetical protein
MLRIVGFLSVISVYFFTSCEKVIELDLNEANKKYVIEGTVQDGETVHYVRVTSTQNIEATDNPPAVTNAVVVISDNAGNSETLTMVEPGLYATATLLGVENRKYTITVTIDGEVFTASSTMPQKVLIDTLTVQTFPFGDIVFNSIVANRMDPVDVENFYQFNLYRNDTLVPGIYLQDDKFANGVEFLQPIFGGDYASGDLATVEMFCIDKPVYRYFVALDQNGGGTGGATPANPDSNFGKACLGYFSARTRQVKSVIIP